jgi:hypothetical protein
VEQLMQNIKISFFFYIPFASLMLEFGSMFCFPQATKHMSEYEESEPSGFGPTPATARWADQLSTRD